MKVFAQNMDAPFYLNVATYMLFVPFIKVRMTALGTTKNKTGLVTSSTFGLKRPRAFSLSFSCLAKFYDKL